MSADLPASSSGPLEHRAGDWSWAAGVSFCVALAVVAPFFYLGTASGHDVAFHMASWLDAAGQWKQGILFPRWAEWANFGFGEPRFVFYPPMSWLIGAFLGTLIPWQSVALVFILCVQTFAGISAFALLRNVAGSRWAVFFGAACFAANPYALLIVYMRSDFAELLAIAFFPLLLLAALRLSGGIAGEPSRGRFTGLFLFAANFAAIWLSNAPAAVIATYSMALLFAVAAIHQRSAKALVSGAIGMTVGFCLAAFYLVPAIYEQRWVNISSALAEGLTPVDNFLFAKTSDAEHDAFNHIASKLAVLLAVWLVLAAIATWRQLSSLQAAKPASETRWMIVTLSATAILLMMPFTAMLWNILPELRFVQFPWRWMSILALGAITLATLSFRGPLRWIWPVGAAIALLGCGNFLVRHAWWDTEDMPTLQAAIQSGVGFEGTDEYDPLGDDHSLLPQKQPRAEMIFSPADSATHMQIRITIEQWSAEHQRIRVAARRPGHLALRLLDYPAWRATVNGQRVELLGTKNTRQVVVQVPEGNSEIQLDFTRTFDRTLGGWVSLASVLTCFWKFGKSSRSPRTAVDQ